jgi:hypothetical protein
MNFWDIHDLALIHLRQEAIKIIEDFEGKNIKDENYTIKLHKLLNNNLRVKTNTLTKASISTTLKNMLLL